jgi:hypothetical protein
MKQKIISLDDMPMDFVVCRSLYGFFKERPELKDKYVYIRGVAPNEAMLAVVKENGRVDNKKAVTNRGSDEARLSFGLNENGLKGISLQVLEDVILEIAYYANMGAYVEATGQKDISSKFQGYFLVFATNKPLDRHGINPAMYGHNWRTTAELPEGIEDSLVFVIKAPVSDGPSSFKSFDISKNVKVTGHIKEDNLAYSRIAADDK